MKRLLWLIVVSLVLLPLLVPARPVLAADRVLRVTPEKWVLEQVGEVTTIEVKAENVEGLYAVELKLSFDPNLVEVVTAGGQLATRVETGELVPGAKFEGANKVDNATGTIHFIYTLFGPKTSGTSGDGAIIRFVLRVKALGEGAITIEKGDLVEKSSDNVLGQATPVLHHGRLRTASSPNQPEIDSSAGNGSGSPQTNQPTVPATSSGVGHVLSGSDLTLMTSSDLADGEAVNRTMVSLSNAAMRSAISAAAIAGCGMRVEFPEYAQDASAARQEVSLHLPADELADLAQVGLDLVGPAGTLVQVPGALLQQLATSGQGFSFTSTQIGQSAANDLLQEDGSALAAEDIEANLAGPTTLRFLAPVGADLATLRIRVIHSDGSVEDMTPAVRADGDAQYLEIVVNRFSTFIIYRPILAEDASALLPISVTLTIDRLDASVNDQPYQLLSVPYVVPASGRTMVPVRFVSEALGAKVDWLPETREVRIVDGDTTIVLTIDSKLVTVNGSPKALDAPATLRSGVTYVPLRFVSEALGADVRYDGSAKQILIKR